MDIQLHGKKLKAGMKVKCPRIQNRIGESSIRMIHKSALEKRSPMKKTLSVYEAITSANKRRFFEKSRRESQNLQPISYSKKVVVRQFQGNRGKPIQNTVLEDSDGDWNPDDEEANIESESDTSKNEDLEALIVQEECENESEHANTNNFQGSSKKNTRGPSKCKHIHARGLEERDTITINDKGQPIGDNKICNEFSRFLGSIARNPTFVPLTIENWSKFPQKQKDKLWKYVNDKYIVPDGAKSWVLKTISSSWRVYKSRLKKRFLTGYKNFAERIANRPKNIPSALFATLLRYWDKEKVKDISRKNKENRLKLKNAHRVGPKSFARVREELMANKESNEEPSNIEMFIETRRSRGRTKLDEDTAAKVSQLQEIQLKTEDSHEHEKEFVEVMGKQRAARMHFFGRGVTHKSLKAEAINGSKKNPQGDNDVQKNLEDRLDRRENVFQSAFTLLLQSNPTLVVPPELLHLLHPPIQQKGSTNTRNLESQQDNSYDREIGENAQRLEDE